MVKELKQKIFPSTQQTNDTLADFFCATEGLFVCEGNARLCESFVNTQSKQCPFSNVTFVDLFEPLSSAYLILRCNTFFFIRTIL